MIKIDFSKFQQIAKFQQYCAPFDLEFNDEKNKPWSENEQQVIYFEKTVMYIKNFRKQPLLLYNKIFEFACSTSTVILMKLQVMSRHCGMFFKISALKISVKPLNEFVFRTFAKVLSNFLNILDIGRTPISNGTHFFYKQRFFST